MTDGQTAEEPKSKAVIQRVIIIVIIFGVILVLLAVAIPAFVECRETACQRACIRNLQMIDAGRKQSDQVDLSGLEKQLEREQSNLSQEQTRRNVIRPSEATR